MAEGKRSPMNYLKSFFLYTYGYRLEIVLRIFLGTLRVILGLLMVYFSKVFIDETIKTENHEEIFQMILILVFTLLGSIFCRVLYSYKTTITVTQCANNIRKKYFKEIFKRNLYSSKELHSGDVSSRFSKDVDSISEVCVDTFPQIIVTFIQLLLAFFLLRWFDPKLAFLLLFLTPIFLILGKLLSRKLRNMTLLIRENESKIQMQIQEGMEYNALLQTMGSSPWMVQILEERQQELLKNTRKRGMFTMATRIIFGITLGLGYLLAFIYGGLGLRSGAITFGVMTSFLQLVSQIQNPIFSMLNMGPKIIHASASFDRLSELTKGNSAEEKTENIDANSLGIHLKNIVFGYENKNVIKNFSYDFKPGSKTAILGETGIGKTTLLRLILKMIKPNEGTISLYSTNDKKNPSIEEYNFYKNNPQVLGFVPQGGSLLSGSIRYNLMLAKNDATEEEIKKALHSAYADFVFELPLGLDFIVGERGVGLSEGQAQRIAIARSLLQNPKILLFDEISSALDEKSEEEMFKRLFEKNKEKTMIFVTHREVVCKHCDNILRLS